MPNVLEVIISDCATVFQGILKSPQVPQNHFKREGEKTANLKMRTHFFFAFK